MTVLLSVTAWGTRYSLPNFIASSYAKPPFVARYALHAYQGNCLPRWVGI